jgi:PAS domain S-box-containing protein
MESAIADSENDSLFKVIVESATDFAIYTTDTGGTVTSWNSGAQRLFGYAEPEIVGSSGDVVFVPEERAEGVPGDERMRAIRDGRASDDRWHLRKDGSRFWASGLLMPLRDHRRGFVKIARDRTDLFEATERLRENEERFRILATSIPQLVFRTRPDGARTWGSPQWIEFTGLSLDDSLAGGWLAAVHPDDRQLTIDGWQRARETGEYHVEHRIRRASDGAWRWHQTRARPVDRSDIDGFDWVGTMTDIDDLRSMKDRQQVMMAELQHRTRNLLAVVQSLAGQSLRSSSSIAEFGAEFGSRLQALSRVQSILAATDHGAVDLHMLVTSELEAHAEAGAGTGKILIDGPPVALPAIAAQAFGLALHELTTNASKYGALSQPAGKLHVHWEVVRTGDRPDGPAQVKLHWEETGVEMAPAGVAGRRGYGTELIERALPYQLQARTRLEFRPDGVFCRIAVPLAAGNGKKSHE